MTKSHNTSVCLIIMLIPLMDMLIYNGTPMLNILIVVSFIIYLAKSGLKRSKTNVILLWSLLAFTLYDISHYVFVPLTSL